MLRSLQIYASVEVERAKVDKQVGTAYGLSDHKPDGGDFAVPSKTMATVVLQIETIFRRFFLHIRQGVLLQNLFRALQCTSSLAISNTVEQYIWAAWGAHENETIVRYMQ